MFEVELPRQEVAENGDSIVTLLFLGAPSRMSLENTFSLQGTEQQYSDAGEDSIFLVVIISLRNTCFKCI